MSQKLFVVEPTPSFNSNFKITESKKDQTIFRSNPSSFAILRVAVICICQFSNNYFSIILVAITKLHWMACCFWDVTFIIITNILAKTLTKTGHFVFHGNEISHLLIPISCFTNETNKNWHHMAATKKL